MRIITLLLLMVLVTVSCDPKGNSNLSGAVARVGDSYLYVKDIKGLVVGGGAKEDSIKVIHNYINSWASKKMLVDAAENNINDEAKLEIERLVEQYKTDLYTNLYIERLVSRSLDTVVSESEIRSLYEETKSHFKQNTTLLKLRFIVLQNEHQDYKEIKNRFQKFTEEDRNYIESVGMQLKQYALNEEVWVEANSLYDKFYFMSSENEKEFLIQNKYIEKKDSIDTYLIKINKVVQQGGVSPYEYQKDIVKDILLNKRKLKLISQFKKEITDNAIKNEEFEKFK